MSYFIAILIAILIFTIVFWNKIFPILSIIAGTLHAFADEYNSVYAELENDDEDDSDNAKTE